MAQTPTLAAVAVCAVAAGCGSGTGASETRSARFVERTTHDEPELPTRTVRGAFDWDSRVGWATEKYVGSAIHHRQVGDRCFRRVGDSPDWEESKAQDLDGLCSAEIFRDPYSELALLRRITRLRNLGHEEIDGAETTHYRGRLNIGAVKGQIDVWVDDEERVVRTRQTDDFVSVRDFDDFGLAVEVEAPPATKVRSRG